MYTKKPEVENLKKQNTKKSETEIRSFLATATHNEPHEWVGPWLVSDTKYTTKKRYVLFYVYCIKYKLQTITNIHIYFAKIMFILSE